MKERPILFSGPMVRALLAGRKTQTRRVIKNFEQRDVANAFRSWGLKRRDTFHLWPNARDQVIALCPYGTSGDRLWVRETWFTTRFDAHELKAREFLRYAADGTYDPRLECYGRGWKPSIYMPRWASRITLGITGVRVERLQDIGEADAKAEGVRPHVSGTDGQGPLKSHRTAFVRLWNEINGNWLDDPWVWVLEFNLINVRA